LIDRGGREGIRLLFSFEQDRETEKAHRATAILFVKETTPATESVAVHHWKGAGVSSIGFPEFRKAISVGLIFPVRVYSFADTQAQKVET
jgi:hypothetical protein